MSQVSEVVASILTGTISADDLHSLKCAIQSAGMIGKYQKFDQFSVGDKVQFNSKARPQYLRGKTARVVKKNRTKLVIEMLETTRRFRLGERVTTPTSIIEKVN